MRRDVVFAKSICWQNGSGVVESSELADLLLNMSIEPMSHVLDEATWRCCSCVCQIETNKKNHFEFYSDCYSRRIEHSHTHTHNTTGLNKRNPQSLARLRITKFSDYVVWTDYGLKATTHVKDDDRHADLRKFSLGFVCECGVWIRFCDLSELILTPPCLGFPSLS